MLWFASRGISAWLNGAPRAGNRDLSEEDTRLLRDWAERMCRFFHDWSSEATNWTIPDSVREDGEAALRLSPTNLGMLLNARIAAVHLGILPLPQFVFETQATLDRVALLPKHRGHLLNWYDIATFTPLEPRFVSTVDSGNLAACLWTLKQAALAFAAEPDRQSRRHRWHRGRELDEHCGDLRAIGPRHGLPLPLPALARRFSRWAMMPAPTASKTSSYDLLAVESRIASFVAIAKGDMPQEAWFHSGRAHTLVPGPARALLSWTGTMFEYLMPALWMRHFPGTIPRKANAGRVRIQREFARRKGVPWGISESACSDRTGGDNGYAAFGIPELAMKQPRRRHSSSRRTPHSWHWRRSRVVVKNLRAWRRFGWYRPLSASTKRDRLHDGSSATWFAHGWLTTSA